MDTAENNIPLFKEKLDHLFLNQNLGHAATLVNGIILSVIQWHVISRTFVILWMAALILTIGIRITIVCLYKRHRSSKKSMTYWYRLFLIGLFISGTIWGLPGIILHYGNSIIVEMLITLTIGGMVAGASAIYAPMISAFFAYSLPSMLPVTVIAFAHGGIEHTAIGIMLLLFFTLMSFSCNRNRKVFEASLVLKNEKNDLVNYLSEAKAESEKINIQLEKENTQRKMAEEKLAKHQKDLEQQVESRTRELLIRNEELKLEISERKKAESAFRDSEERYKRLIENAIIGILLIQNGKIIFANSMCSKISGYEQEEIIDKDFFEFVHPDDRELAIDNNTKRLKGEQFEDSYPIRLINRQGDTRWVQVSATCMTYNSRQTILTFFKDITQQRHLELQIMQSEKMASIGQLAAGVAHEINNPIGYISSNLHTLGEYQGQLHELITKYRELSALFEKKPDQFENNIFLSGLKAIEKLETEIDINFIMDDLPLLIKQSEDGTDRVKKIVSDLKNFAHPGDEKKQFTDINSNIESTLNMLWNELKYHVEVIKDLGDIPAVECYPQLLNQVFMNLIVNSAQAIEGKGIIRIKTSWHDNSAEIKISDNGMGIPKENLGKIYDPFFTTKDVGKGTGLGLHLCYNIIKKHQGTILVESIEGKGTTFTISLPLS